MNKEKFLKEILKYWNRVPDYRFGQIMYNVLCASDTDPFFLSDEAILELFKKELSNTPFHKESVSSE